MTQRKATKEQLAKCSGFDHQICYSCKRHSKNAAQTLVSGLTVMGKGRKVCEHWIKRSS
jgi:hypothetical protein